MSLSNVSNQNKDTFSLEQFEQIAGSDKSTGFVKLDGEKLQKAGAHRYLLTFKNKAEVDSLHGADNALVRCRLFEAVQNALRTSEGEQATREERIDHYHMLKATALRLGIPVESNEEALTVTRSNNNQNHGLISQENLLRSDVRNIIRLLKSPDYKLLLQRPSESDKEISPATLQARDVLIGTMKKTFPDIRWDQVPFGAMDLGSLRTLANMLVGHEITTMQQVKDFCESKQRRDQINEEEALIQLKYTQQKMSTEQGKDEVNRLVTMPLDSPKIEAENEEVKDEPQYLFVDDEGSVSDEDEVVAVDAKALEKQIAGLNIFERQSALNDAFQKGKIEPLLEDFIVDVLEVASKGKSIEKETLLAHRAALTFLVSEKENEVYAALDSVRYGSLLKSKIASIRESAGIGKIMMKSVIYAGIDKSLTPEMIGDLQKNLTEALAPTKRNKVCSIIEENPKDAMKNLRDDLQAWLKPDPTLTLDKRVQVILSTLYANSTALTALLCAPDKMLPHFGNEKLLKPVLEALRGKLNLEMNKAVHAQLKEGDSNPVEEEDEAESIQEDSDSVKGEDEPEVIPEAKPEVLEQTKVKDDFVNLKFAGRIAVELENILFELVQKPDLTKAFAPSGLVSEEETRKILIDLLQNFVGDAFQTTALTKEITEAQAGLSKVDVAAVHNFLADIVLEQETWITDMAKPGERMKKMLGRHLDTLAVLLCNPEKYVKEMGLPKEVLDMVKALTKMVEPLTALFGPGNEGFALVALRKSIERMNTNGLSDFAALEKLVDDTTQAAMATIQDIASIAFEGMLKGEPLGNFSDIQGHLKATKEFDTAMRSPEGALLPEAYQERFVGALDKLKAEGIQIANYEMEAFKEALKTVKLTPEEQQLLCEDFRVEDLFERTFKEKSEIDQREHVAKRDFADVSFVAKLVARLDARNNEPLRSLKERFNSTVDLGIGLQVTEIDHVMVRVKKKFLDGVEARFYERLDGMSLRDGFDLWAKHKHYDAPTRELMLKKLEKDFNSDEQDKSVFERVDNLSTTKFSHFRKGFKTIDEKMDDYFKSPGFPLKFFTLPDANNPNAMELHRIREASLDELSGSGALDTKTGYGKFMVDVMKRYFAEVAPEDKRSMLSALLRYGKLQTVKEDAKPEERAEVNRNNLANLMGSLFKGAGPIMQKLLQQLGSLQVPDAFKAALKDMKCNLLPIPEAMVQAQLFGIVESYNRDVDAARQAGKTPGPKIVNIRMEKVMGAASVGEAVLCKVSYEGDNKDRTVIVKLLRPEAENRMRREEGLFLDVAKKIGGMEQTYHGRLERIKEELDLRVEASNVKAGVIYDAPFKDTDKKVYTDVKSMKLAEGFKASKTTMVIECAPGTTLSNYLDETAQMRKTLVKSLNDKTILEATRINRVSQFNERIDDLIAKADQLTRLANKWVTQGLFKQGFYHGDLHAGNIMVDDKKEGGVDKGLTVIDFGNATKLSKSEQQSIMRMIYGVVEGDAKLFLENYKQLMNPESATKLSGDKYNTALERLQLVFKKGDESLAGVRIMAALNELQKLDLELPAPIFNFSQCQILLQGTLAQINNEIAACEDVRNKYLSEVFNVQTFPMKIQSDTSMVQQLLCEQSPEFLAQIDDLAKEALDRVAKDPKVNNGNKISDDTKSRVVHEFIQQQIALKEQKKENYMTDDMKFLVLYKYIQQQSALRKQGDKNDLDEAAEIVHKATELDLQRQSLAQQIKSLEADFKGLQLFGPKQRYYEHFTLDSEAEKLLGISKTDSHAAGSVRKKVEELLKSTTNEKKKALLLALREKIQGFPENYSLREPFPLEIIPEKFLQFFSECPEPRTKENVVKFLDEKKAEFWGRMQEFKPSIDAYNKLAHDSSSSEIDVFRAQYIDDQKKINPKVDKKQLETRLDAFFEAKSLEAIENAQPRDEAMCALCQLFRTKFGAFSGQDGNLVVPSRAVYSKGAVPFAPFYVKKFTSAVQSPALSPDYPKDFFDWSEKKKDQIKNYSNEELVFSSCTLSAVFKKEVQKSPIGEKAESLRSGVEKRIGELKITHRLTDADWQKTSKTIPHRDKLSEFSGIVGVLASNKVDMKSESGKKLEKTLKLTEPKDFFKVVGDAILDNKWSSAKAVGAQAILKAIWKSIF